MITNRFLKTLALPVAVALGMFTASCSNDDNILDEQQPSAAKYEIPVTVSATRSGDDASTRAVYDSGTRKLTFEEGDQLFIQGTDATAGTFAGLLSNTAGAASTFSGTLTTTNEYTGTFGELFSSATSLTATLLPKDYGTEAAGYLTLSGSGASQTLTVDATKAFVTAASADAAKKLAIEQLSLERVTAYSSGFALAPVNAVLSYSIIGLANSTAYTPSVSDATTAISGSVTSDASGNACFAVAFAPAGSKTYTLSISGFSDIAVADRTLTAGMVYKKTATAAAAVPEGALSGQFTVGMDGSTPRKVYFSQGNLQYDGTNWKFATNQYDVLGANGTKANGTATGYPMDLFTWGNTSSSTEWSGNSYYTVNADLSSTTDWGSNIGGGWYTLSKDEWLYLFGMESNNTDKSGHARYRKYFRATVNDVKGIVVLPDDITGISDIPDVENRGTASTFEGKTYTTDAWSDLESAGCVFLPAAGYRGGTSVNEVGSEGYYWSSTAESAGYAYRVNFNSWRVYPAGYNRRNDGYSVRLVRVAD